MAITSYQNNVIFYENSIIAASEKKTHIMKVVLVDPTHTSYSFLDCNESKIEGGYTSNCLLNLFGKPIITRNFIIGSICG